jgi:hypothetical protein
VKRSPQYQKAYDLVVTWIERNYGHPHPVLTEAEENLVTMIEGALYEETHR